MRKIVRSLGVISALWIVGALLVNWGEIGYSFYFQRHKDEILSKYNAAVQAFESQEALKKQREDEAKRQKDELLQKQELERLVRQGVSVDAARIITSQVSTQPQEDVMEKVVHDLELHDRPDYPRYRKPETERIMSVAFLPPVLAWLLLLSISGGIFGVRYLGRNFEYRVAARGEFQLNGLQRGMAGVAGIAILVVVWQGLQTSEIGTMTVVLSILSICALLGVSTHGLKRK